MPEYRRACVPGETFFFTVVSDNRAPILCTDLGRSCLRSPIRQPVGRVSRPDARPMMKGIKMPSFIRAHQPGGTFFLTLVTHKRRHVFQSDMARRCLRMAFHDVAESRPFKMPAIVLLPDHLHCIWTPPERDSDFSTRVRKLKEYVARSFSAGGIEAIVSPGKTRKGLRGVWQPRFWEHTIRDECDFQRHLDYIHFDPVKHALVRCPHEWPWTTFSRWVRRKVYDRAWCCSCAGDLYRPPSFDDIAHCARE
jgi:putative transposase